MNSLMRRRNMMQKHEGVEPGLLYNWDFTKSLVDTVHGVEAILQARSGTTLPYRDSSGIHFDGACKECYLIGHIDARNKRIEVDVASFTNTISTAGHVAVITCGSSDLATELSYGLFGRKSAYNLAFYTGGWSESSTNVSAIDGKTIKIITDASENPSLYLDDTFILSRSGKFGGGTTGDKSIRIGNIRAAASGGNFQVAVISGARIYDATVS